MTTNRPKADRPGSLHDTDQAGGPVALAVQADPADDPALLARARQLSAALNLPLVMEQPTDKPLILTVTPVRLELRTPGLGGNPVAAALEHLDIRSHAGRSLRQPLARAVGAAGLPRPHVLDATAGWGEDTWILAALGCQVDALERHPVVAVLLADAIERAKVHHPEVSSRIRLTQGDAIQRLEQLALTPPDGQPDTVLLDPMFPAGRKTAERKPMQVLRQLVGDDPDASGLLQAALSAARRRVVVKRPAKAASLPGRKPDVIYPGKAVRFDVYLLHGR